MKGGELQLQETSSSRVLDNDNPSDSDPLLPLNNVDFRSPLTSPTPVVATFGEVKDNNNNNNNNNNNSDDDDDVEDGSIPTCRICLECDGEEDDDLISPCMCKGTQQFVHRSCLDHWRSVKEGHAFSHCTTCKSQFHLRVIELEENSWRKMKFRLFVARDVCLGFLAVQTVIGLMGGLAYLADKDGSFRDSFNDSWDRILSRHPIPFYYCIGPHEITTRWTMEMTFSLLPWKPLLVFTGTSVMGINPENGKFCSHVDYWDSIKNNEYFSSEGLVDLIKQLRIYKTPDLETPKYQILKRTANYEVRKYNPFIIVETQSDKLASSTGFNDVAGYIFGKNSREEKIPMTTPVFTQAFDTEMSKMSIQIVIPSNKDMESLPDPNKEDISLRSVQGGFAAVLKFSGKPTEDVVREKEKLLRSSLISDGLKPKEGCLLARYNDPGRTKSFMLRNEVLIWLEEFVLD